MALQATDITFSYDSRFSIRGASLRAEAGEWVSVIGPNGSGKTTFLKILCGLRSPDSGTVLLDGQPIASYPSNRRARHLAFVPQSYQPAFEFTVEQSVLLGRMPYRGSVGGFERAEDIAAADEALRLLELDELRSAPVTQLSGGELQRVMIARALAQGSGTLVLDEPTSHLDIAHQQSVLATIREQMERRHLTVIASIHDLNLASIFSDSISVVHDGRTVRQDTPARVLTESLLHDVFGVELEVEPEIYGGAPSVRYRYNRRSAHDAV